MREAQPKYAMPPVFPRYTLAEVANYQALFIAGEDGKEILNEATALTVAPAATG
jgi:hypothetical protein